MKRAPSNISIPSESNQRLRFVRRNLLLFDLGPNLTSSRVIKAHSVAHVAEARLGYRAITNGILPMLGRVQHSVSGGMPKRRHLDREQRRMVVSVCRSKTQQGTAEQKSSCPTKRVSKNRHPNRKSSCQSHRSCKRTRQDRSDQQPYQHLLHPSQHSHWLFLEEDSLAFVAKIGRDCDESARTEIPHSGAPERQRLFQ